MSINLQLFIAKFIIMYLNKTFDQTHLNDIVHIKTTDKQHNNIKTSLFNLNYKDFFILSLDFKNQYLI